MSLTLVWQIFQQLILKVLMVSPVYFYANKFSSWMWKKSEKIKSPIVGLWALKSIENNHKDGAIKGTFLEVH